MDIGHCFRVGYYSVALWNNNNILSYSASVDDGLYY